MFNFLSREPVRAYLYSLVVAVLGALVAFGVVDTEQLPVLLGLAAAVFAVEAARNRVEPVKPSVPPEPAAAADQSPPG